MNKTEHHKKAVLDALEQTLGVVTSACKLADVGRTTFYKWMKTDPEFREAVESINDIALDYSETALFKQINSGNISAIIFHLKTRGKKRGYVEKQEIKLEGDIKSTIVEWIPSTQEE